MEKWERWRESGGFTRGERVIKLLYTFFTRDFRGDLHEKLARFARDFHKFNKKFIQLIIEFAPDFFDIFAKFKVDAEVVGDFFYAMHNGGVIGDADFGSDFASA